MRPKRILPSAYQAKRNAGYVADNHKKGMSVRTDGGVCLQRDRKVEAVRVFDPRWMLFCFEVKDYQ